LRIPLIPIADLRDGIPLPFDVRADFWQPLRAFLRGCRVFHRLQAAPSGDSADRDRGV
jgi:hypothetical protein